MLPPTLAARSCCPVSPVAQADCEADRSVGHRHGVCGGRQRRQRGRGGHPGGAGEEQHPVQVRMGGVGGGGRGKVQLYETCTTSALAGHLQFECLTLLLFGPAILPRSVVGVPKSIGAKAGRVLAGCRRRGCTTADATLCCAGTARSHLSNLNQYALLINNHTLQPATTSSRQRHPADRQDLWLRYGGGGGAARAHGGQGAPAGMAALQRCARAEVCTRFCLRIQACFAHAAQPASLTRCPSSAATGSPLAGGGQQRLQRHWPCQAHGPAVGLHRHAGVHGLGRGGHRALPLCACLWGWALHGGGCRPWSRWLKPCSRCVPCITLPPTLLALPSCIAPAVPHPRGALQAGGRDRHVCVPGEGAEREGARGGVRGRGRGPGAHAAGLDRAGGCAAAQHCGAAVLLHQPACKGPNHARLRSPAALPAPPSELRHQLQHQTTLQHISPIRTHHHPCRTSWARTSRRTPAATRS